MKNRPLWMGLAVGLGVACAVPATSQVRPETQLRQRQAVMILHAKYFYPIRNQAQGKIPYDAKIVARNVGFLEQLSRMPWDGFVPATKDLKSQATPAVFTETAKFKEAQDRYMAEVTTLADVTRKGGDEASIKAQIMAVDKSCNVCHDTFRERQ